MAQKVARANGNHCFSRAVTVGTPVLAIEPSLKGFESPRCQR